MSDLFDRTFIQRWIGSKNWLKYDAFVTHLLVKVVSGPENFIHLKNIFEEIELFNSSFDLVSHMSASHTNLPIDMFIDQLYQKTCVPTVVKPPSLNLQNQKTYSHFVHNIYRDLSAADIKGPIFGEKTLEDRERNQAYLVYCYGALALQIQSHFESPQPMGSTNKFQVIGQYLTNLLLMISNDEFEVAGNGECLTESDRKEFCKFHLINMIVQLCSE